jgi:hypothetical protein
MGWVFYSGLHNQLQEELRCEVHSNCKAKKRHDLKIKDRDAFLFMNELPAESRRETCPRIIKNLFPFLRYYCDTGVTLITVSRRKCRVNWKNKKNNNTESFQ